jgi:hypothetical protein
MSIHVVGLDLGQSPDFTGIVTLKLDGTPGSVLKAKEGPPITKVQAYVERFPNDVPYKQIAADVTAAMRQLPGPVLVIDAGGVGRGAREFFWHLNPIEVTITGGQKVTLGDERPLQYNVPKRDLVAVTQITLRDAEVRFQGPHAEILKRELQNFRMRISAAGFDSYAALPREGQHDDLVLAAALAIWTADQTLRMMAQAALEGLVIPSGPYRISAV